MPRKSVTCPLCGYSTWNDHLDKHQKKPECQFAVRCKAFREKGFMRAGGEYQTLKAVGAPMEKFFSDFVMDMEKKAGSKPVYVARETERWWVPVWAMAVLFIHAGVAKRTQPTIPRRKWLARLRQEMREAQEGGKELQEALVQEAKIFFGLRT
jgi:hypothetical protein